MPVLFLQTLPEGATLDVVKEVTEEMGVRNSPPAGLVIHTAYERDGRVHIADVWESQANFEQFAQERLGPAFENVLARRGIDPSQMGQPTQDFFDIKDLVTGSPA